MYQYFHQMNHKERLTVCLEVPKKDLLLNYLNVDGPKEITLNMGITFVHPKEFYCKRIGREESQKRLKPVTFKITSVDIEENCVMMNFTVSDDYYIQFRVHKYGKEVHFIHFIKWVKNGYV